MKRESSKKRKTEETDISIDLEIASIEKSDISTGVPFLDHMLNSMARHGRFCLKLTCAGDTEVDDHHSVEDTAICLGSALKDALGDKAGINRFGEAIVPMDDALVMVALDFSGRSYFALSGHDFNGQIGMYHEELTAEFLRSFSVNADLNLHVRVLDGVNRHHIHEAIFKALGIAVYRAVSFDNFLEGTTLSTKGMLE